MIPSADPRPSHPELSRKVQGQGAAWDGHTDPLPPQSTARTEAPALAEKGLTFLLNSEA